MDLRRVLTIITVLYINLAVTSPSLAQNSETSHYEFGPFNSTYYNTFAVLTPATISNNALQVTPDSAGNFTLNHRSGRIFFNQSFTLWEEQQGGATRVVSFNTSFLINVYRVDNSSVPGEGLAFLIAPDLSLPSNSSGQYLGLTNSTTDGDSSNGIVAIELDTFKEDFDPDDNHMGLNIHSIRSNKTESLSKFGIQISPVGTKVYMVWVHYDGVKKALDVYMAEQGSAKPTTPVLTADLDLGALVHQESYFGFAASTGSAIQLNCVLAWNLTVELLHSATPKNGGNDDKLIKICIGAGVPGLVLLLIGVAGLTYYLRKKRAASGPNLLGALKSLPGTPREFRFRDLKKATNNFDEKNKLGQGWCHKNGMLLLVYDYMPNGSLDKQIFHGPEEKNTLEWKLRHNIIAGVASALHYLHNEYDQKVVHRDLKASNIMLDSNFNARLGDFGLARALENEKTSYAELEGVPVLEVVCGQRPWTKIAGFQFLVDWVWWLHREGRILEAVDERLGNNYDVEEAQRLLLLGLACSHPIASERPKTHEIFQMISGSVAVPRVPPFKPAFVWPSATGPDVSGITDFTADTIPITSDWTPQSVSPQSYAGDYTNSSFA
ncbi:hypothetical protein GH714_035002 [Hevea brasiliensis]|uniref:non-specific serine/threonine protein kinase n=1 Tax=Hevea brasiliensis TaxID=3981 RepID=A0A6A6MJH2_HEVBR|nr:hypothetical protein GH714_035002 [Hevea brasiliensis]